MSMLQKLNRGKHWMSQGSSHRGQPWQSWQSSCWRCWRCWRRRTFSWEAHVGEPQPSSLSRQDQAGVDWAEVSWLWTDGTWTEKTFQKLVESSVPCLPLARPLTEYMPSRSAPRKTVWIAPWCSCTVSQICTRLHLSSSPLPLCFCLLGS